MRRDAFSLMEVILVLVLLVIVAAIAVPYTESMFREARPRAAADAVRAALLQARTHAMEEGRSYRFAIIPGGVTFRVAPHDDDFWTGSGEGPPAPEGAVQPYLLAKNLPGGVTFGGGAGGPALASANAGPTRNTQQPNPKTIPAEQFESVVVFFSDGTAETDVEITFQAGGGPGLVLCLRGLTGVATVRTQYPQQGGLHR